jgi:phage tail-like protein
MREVDPSPVQRHQHRLYNEAGQLVIAYIVHRCWVSEFQALPDLDADAGTMAFQRITLENEGWERDVSV